MDCSLGRRSLRRKTAISGGLTSAVLGGLTDAIIFHHTGPCGLSCFSEMSETLGTRSGTRVPAGPIRDNVRAKTFQKVDPLASVTDKGAGHPRPTAGLAEGLNAGEPHRSPTPPGSNADVTPTLNCCQKQSFVSPRLRHGSTLVTIGLRRYSLSTTLCSRLSGFNSGSESAVHLASAAGLAQPVPPSPSREPSFTRPTRRDQAPLADPAGDIMLHPPILFTYINGIILNGLYLGSESLRAAPRVVDA
jgi:hypothetical protein